MTAGRRRYVCPGCARRHDVGEPCPRCPGGPMTTTHIAHRAVIDELRAIEDVRTEDVPLVHGRVYTDLYNTSFADDPGGRRDIVTRIAYRLRRGWRAERPRKVVERRPADAWFGWPEDAAWG